MMHRNATNAARPPSLVDTLGAGFRALNRRLPVLLVPLLLNVWYWIGPRISLRPLAERLRAFNPASWDQARQQLEESLLLGGTLDLRLGVRFPFWNKIYTLVPVLDADRPIEATPWHIGGIFALLVTVVAINLVLTLLTALYLTPIADAVRGTSVPGNFARRVMRAWLALLGIAAMVLALLAVVGTPLVAVAFVLAGSLPALGTLLMFFLMLATVWIFFSASFAYDAVVVSGAGPIQAMLTSLLLVRRFFWSAAGLFLLSWFILRGLGIIWANLSSSLPGLLLAMVTSAYVGAGMVAAHLVFYRDRLRPAPPTAS